MIKTMTIALAIAATAAPVVAAPLRIETPWLRETPPAARTILTSAGQTPAPRGPGGAAHIP